MSEEILINVTPVETRVALVENGMLQEVYIERTSRKGIVGNIYKGKVVRVLPGMEAAFVDIGLERAAFIHASDVVASQQNGSDEPVEAPRTVPDIRTLLREGQSLVVQVTKDPIGTKGARLTTQLSIPSRYLVYMPGVSHIGISQRIEDETERARLREIVERGAVEGAVEGAINGAVEGAIGGAVEGATEGSPEGTTEQKVSSGGYIIRTAAESAAEQDLIADMNFLNRLNQSVNERISRVKAPAVVYQDLPLFIRTIRDLIRPQTEKVRIDSRESYQRVIEFVAEFVTEFQDKVEYYPGERPIFDLYSVEDEIQKALSRKVQLKSGGYVIIDQTEAMTTIDVNTGGFVGHRNLEETIFKTNLEAARAISRQLRLRNLGGIIIIDFIDMDDPEHQRQVHRMLEKMLERDHAKTKITGVSELGLVEMTRKRTTESLGQVLCESCPVCDGRGFLKTSETVCYEIFREILRINRAYEPENYLVMASQSVVDRLLDEESDNVADLETFIGKSIRFQVEPFYSQEQYDVVLL